MSLGALQGKLCVPHGAADAHRKRAGQSIASRAQCRQKRSDMGDRSEDEVPAAHVDQAIRLPEQAGQGDERVVQILDQEVESGKGVPEKQIVDARVDLVRLQEDVPGSFHIIVEPSAKTQ
jgi:hypothetical protein